MKYRYCRAPEAGRWLVETVEQRPKIVSVHKTIRAARALAKERNRDAPKQAKKSPREIAEQVLTNVEYPSRNSLTDFWISV